MKGVVKLYIEINDQYCEIPLILEPESFNNSLHPELTFRQSIDWVAEVAKQELHNFFTPPTISTT